MATFITIAIIITVITGTAVGVFLKISFAIRREDKRHSLRFDAPSSSTQAARSLVGVSRSGWGY